MIYSYQCQLCKRVITANGTGKLHLAKLEHLRVAHKLEYNSYRQLEDMANKAKNEGVKFFNSLFKHLV